MGAGNSASDAQQNITGTPESLIQPLSQPEVVVQKKFSGKAIASFIVALAGLFIAAIICGIVGLVLGRVAIQEINTKGNLKGKGLAIAGMIISIIDIVIMTISFM
jgi:hypothetical protein